jgi:hypothetical protein
MQMQGREIERVMVVVGVHQPAREVAALVVKQIAQHTDAGLAVRPGRVAAGHLGRPG